jgi:hypothetical protein
MSHSSLETLGILEILRPLAMFCCAHALAGLSGEARIMILVGADRFPKVKIALRSTSAEQTEQARAVHRHKAPSFHCCRGLDKHKC